MTLSLLFDKVQLSEKVEEKVDSPNPDFDNGLFNGSGRSRRIVENGGDRDSLKKFEQLKNQTVRV